MSDQFGAFDPEIGTPDVPDGYWEEVEKWMRMKPSDAKRSEVDRKILRLSLTALSNAFDEFIGACMTPDGSATAPSKAALMKARACLPPSSKHALKKSG